MEGSHSPFGVIWQIATATGWSLHYILWKVNYQTLVMMSADAVRYVSAKKRKRGGDQRATARVAPTTALQYFQTRLK